MDLGALRWAAFSVLGFLSLISAKCGGPTTIKQLRVPSAITTCITWSGDIHVQDIPLTPTAGEAPPTIDFGSLATVSPGSLKFSNIKPMDESRGQPLRKLHSLESSSPGKRALKGPHLVISAGALGVVDDHLSFNDMENVVMPSFPSLTSAGTIEFSEVTFSDSPTFGSRNVSILNAVQTLNFTQTNIAGIDLYSSPLEPPDGFTNTFLIVKDNPNLQSIYIPGFFDGSKLNIDIQGNSAYPSVIFPDVTNAFLNVRGVSTFDAPSLASLTPNDAGDTQMIADSKFRTLSLPKLTDITGSLDITGNSKLSNLDLPNLGHADTLEIFNNSQLSNVSIPTTVGGQVTIGCSSNFNCQSIELGSQCNCRPSSSPSSSTAGGNPFVTATPASSSNSGGGLSANAKIGIGVGVGAGGALLLAGALFFFCCRGHRKSSNTPHEISTEGYSKSQHSYNGSGEVTYGKVPYHPGSAGEMREPHSAELTPTSMLASSWSPPEQNVRPTEGRAELEEQQGMRHEMDARSLPDIDFDEDDEAETRSLEDIERVHGQR